MAVRIGTAVQDISPPTPVALSGYPYVEHVASGVHDPLMACALHIRSGNTGIILVSLDLIGLDVATARDVRQAVARATAVPEDRIFISCTHTYSGPPTNQWLCWIDDPNSPKPDPAYLALVREQTVAAASHAAATTRPAEIAWTTAGDGIAVLAVREENNGPFQAAVLISDVAPALLDESLAQISADFPNYTRKCLQETFGDTLTVLFLTAPCASVPVDPRWGNCSLEETEKLGREIGRAVGSSLGNLAGSDFTSDVVLHGRRADVTLPLRATMPSVWNAKVRWSECMAERDRLQANGADRTAIRIAGHAVTEARGAMNIAQAKKDGVLKRWSALCQPAEVQVLRIGERYLAGMPGVLFAEYGRSIRERSGGKVLPVSMVNGDLQGYIVTAKAAEAVGLDKRIGSIEPGKDADLVVVDDAIAVHLTIAEGQIVFRN